MNKAIPQVGHFCQVNYDGRQCIAMVTEVRESEFDVITSFKERMYNIPNDKFTYSKDLGTLIVNMIDENYNLELLTVDAAAMTDDINELIREKAWMVDLTLSNPSPVGRG